MILATDVDYRNGMAHVAGIIFETWESQDVTAEYTLCMKTPSEYLPGRFALRELPCIIQLIERIHHHLRCIIVDGFVHLGGQNRPGLGKYLWHQLNGTVPVIGVAKSFFKDTPASAKLVRGLSQKPLFVTAEGINVETAKQNILAMNGNHRIPTLLKHVDRLCRSSQKKGKSITSKTSHRVRRTSENMLAMHKDGSESFSLKPRIVSHYPNR